MKRYIVVRKRQVLLFAVCIYHSIILNFDDYMMIQGLLTILSMKLLTSNRQIFSQVKQSGIAWRPRLRRLFTFRQQILSIRRENRVQDRIVASIKRHIALRSLSEQHRAHGDQR